MTDPVPDTDLPRRLADIAGRLADLMARELDILRSPHPGEIAGLQEEKAALVDALTPTFEAVREKPDLVRQAAPGVRQAIKTAITRLRAVSDENVRAIRVAKMFNERLIRALGEALAEQTAPPAYTASGATGAANPPGGMPMAINDSI